MKKTFLSFIMILSLLVTVNVMTLSVNAASANEPDGIIQPDAIASEKSEACESLIFEEDTQKNNVINDTSSGKSALSEYITEKIMPVAAGVITSVCVFLGTLWKIGQTLSSMKGSKELFGKAENAVSNAVENIENSVKNEVFKVTEQIKNIPELEKNISELKNETEILIEECKTLAKMISIGFGASKELVRNGSAREIQRLTERSDEIFSSANQNSEESV